MFLCVHGDKGRSLCSGRNRGDAALPWLRCIPFQGRLTLTQVSDELLEVLGSVAPKALDRLAHLEGVADGPAERDVHGGEEGRRGHAHAVGHIHHLLGQRSCLLLGLHEGSSAELDVEHQSAHRLRSLLADDGCCDGGRSGEG